MTYLLPLALALWRPDSALLAPKERERAGWGVGAATDSKRTPPDFLVGENDGRAEGGAECPTVGTEGTALGETEGATVGLESRQLGEAVGPFVGNNRDPKVGDRVGTPGKNGMKGGELGSSVGRRLGEAVSVGRNEDDEAVGHFVGNNRDPKVGDRVGTPGKNGMKVGGREVKTVGAAVGSELGETLGSVVGGEVGSKLGATDASDVGESEGGTVGEVVGSRVGTEVGREDGERDGSEVGEADDSIGEILVSIRMP
jgi:hypothetical protein